ncbi:response regulator [Paenibacillus sp. FSL R5-0527]|uniref:response regulator transcription factor n=1 Tax=Paenibacillus sp. FSL R5-0527 TaxID=2975321 RepID=UPI00097A0FDC|nr:hypothetical protein BK140_23115 [Paenibacillus macerans]
MMGKLLVVDDEIWFREGLVQLISSNQLGWEVVGEASDGEEAMDAVELYEPNLIITDINMPLMDGLALTEWLSRNHPDVKVIILTGYRDFEYAQRALRYGAVEFLLKPFSLDEAYRVLRKAYEQFRLQSLAVRVKEQERQTKLFRAAVFGLPCDRPLREEWEQRWSPAAFCLLQVHTYGLPEKNYTAKDIGLLHYAATNILEELLQRHQTRGLYFPLRKETFAFLLEPGPQGEAYRSDVQQALQSFIGIRTSWSELGTICQFDDLAGLYEQVNHGQNDGAVTDIGPAGDSRHLKEELLALLVTSDFSALEQRLAEYLEEASALELQPCKTKVYTLVSVFSGILLSDFKHVQAAATGEALNPGHILEIQTAAELLAWAKEKCCEFVNLFVRWLDEQRDNVVIKAKQYLEGNYQQTCSLQTVAAYVHVTPNYFSNLFKKETGISFTHYVSQLRIEKAKALLKGTRLRMTEIAEQVGFDNSSYFAVVFKQITGQSPRAFRKQYIEENK